MVCFLKIGRLLTHTDELRTFVSENKPHIIGINETKLDHTVIDGEVEFDEYQIIRNDRNSFGGGVALYIHDSVPFTLYDAICSNLESLTIKLNIPYVRPILITTIYRPPGSTVDLFPKLEELLKSLEPDDIEIIFMGDLNCDIFKTFKTNDNDTKHIKGYIICLS